jgi:hypothetical protein
VTSKSRADAIYDRIRVIGGTVMPPHRQKERGFLAANFAQGKWDVSFGI